MNGFDQKHKPALDIPVEEVASPVWSERRAILWEWSLALSVALIAALLIRALFFEAFRIPSESMEDTLQVGDYVLVSKMHYGARLPITIGLPFTNMYLENVGLPPLRFPGFSDVKRNDVIVFNVPTEDFPIDRKTHYIKRVIGIPGDTLSIVNKVPYVGGDMVPLKKAMKQMWRARLEPGASFPVDRLKGLNVYQIILPQRKGDAVSFEATAENAKTIQHWEEIASVEPIVRDVSLRSRVFPEGSNYGFDNYGPIVIPKAGETVTLNAQTWDLYKDVIRQFEGHSARKLDGITYEIDGEITVSYTFEQDYFFVMGDNRDSSLDSRAWGFVPEDHVVGKALWVYFSWDAVNDRVRSDRFLTRIQ